MRELDPSLKITTSPLMDLTMSFGQSLLDHHYMGNQLLLYEKSKIRYINGLIRAPNRANPNYEEWEDNDRIIMSWLVNSMEPSITKNWLFLNSSKEI